MRLELSDGSDGLRAGDSCVMGRVTLHHRRIGNGSCRDPLRSHWASSIRAVVLTRTAASLETGADSVAWEETAAMLA